jgi:hypothetical protein
MLHQQLRLISDSNPASARSPENAVGQTINTSKEEKLTQKRDREHSSRFAFQNHLPATPCRFPQIAVEEQERRVGGIPPVSGGGAGCLGNL